MANHTVIINKLLMTYPVGPGLVSALEAYIGTVEQRAISRSVDEVAEKVCLRIHDGPAKNLICGACQQAEEMVPMQMTVDAEIAAARSRNRG